MKKFLTFITMGFIVVHSVYATMTTVTVDHFVYNINDREHCIANHRISGPFAEICGVDDEIYMPTQLKVPASVTYEGQSYPVKVIGSTARNCTNFSGNEKIAAITLGENIEVVQGLNNMPNLMTVKFNSNLKEIFRSFGSCPGLSTLSLPNGLIYITGSFNDIQNSNYKTVISSISIPYSVESINDSFKYNGLKDLIFQEPAISEENVPLTIIESIASENLTTLNIPERIDSLTYNVGGEYLQNFVTSPGCKKYIAIDGILYKKNYSSEKWDAFSYPTSHVAEEYVVPQIISGGRILSDFFREKNNKAPIRCSSIDFSNLTEPIEILHNAFGFAWIAQIKDLTLDNVSRIEAGAFSGLDHAKITLGKDVIDVNYDSFGVGNNKSTYFNVNPDNPLYCSFDDNNIYRKLDTGGVELVICGFIPNKMTVRDEVEIIGEASFSWHNNLTEVTLPMGLRRIETMAFWAAKELVTINFNGTNLEYVGPGAFSGDYYGFNPCKWWIQQPNGPIYLGNLFFKYKGGADPNTHYTVKEGTTVINDYAFSKYTGHGNYYTNWGNGLTKVILPSSLKTIGNSAFYDETNLLLADLNDGIEIIGEAAFSRTGIFSLSIPSSVKRIENSAYSGARIQDDLYIPNNVEFIGESAFAGCSGITNVQIGDFYSDNTMEIGKNAFNYLSNCQKLIIGGAVKNISNGMFRDIAIQSTEGIDINIPESVINIESNAFASGNVKILTIGSSVESVGYGAFFFNYETEWDYDTESEVLLKSNLKEVHALSTTPPTYIYNTEWEEYEENMLFNKFDYIRVPLFVPKGCVEAYKEAKGWRHFAIIVEEGTEVGATPTINADHPELPVEVFTLTGIKVFEGNASNVSVQPGIYLIRQGSTSKKIHISK